MVSSQKVKASQWEGIVLYISTCNKLKSTVVVLKWLIYGQYLNIFKELSWTLNGCPGQ